MNIKYIKPAVGEQLPPVWPDLAKFRHFGTILKVLGKFMKVYLAKC